MYNSVWVSRVTSWVAVCEVRWVCVLVAYSLPAALRRRNKQRGEETTSPFGELARGMSQLASSYCGKVSNLSTPTRTLVVVLQGLDLEIGCPKTPEAPKEIYPCFTEILWTYTKAETRFGM